MASPELERLLNRLPTEELAKAQDMLKQMDDALEHATKRLNRELESAEQVHLATPCSDPKSKSVPCCCNGL
tara:strand:- start:1725 stop:1937 length:213 start_codon:yes stop_codon:yes gene_type:complete